MTDAPLAIVLAAGLSTRMKSNTPKVLHPIAGRPLLAHVLDTVRAAGARPLVVLSKESEPAREMLDGDARVASAEEQLLPESILGAYAADLGWLREAVAQLRPNATGEIFLTDLVAEATREGKRVAVHRTGDPEEGMGVNTRVELAAAEAAL